MNPLDETRDAPPPPAPSTEATLVAENVEDTLTADAAPNKSTRPLRAEPGQRFGRFQTLAKLGEGAMGVVLAAHDEQLDRKVALKFLTRAGGDEVARERLFREARSLARLSHPNIVAVYDVGEIDGTAYLAMELVIGQTLRAWLDGDEQRPPPSRLEVLDMFRAIGRGLAAAHELGVVHRDFKPDNVLVGDDGRPRVVDFGLASIGAVAAPSEAPAFTPDAAPSLTATGSLMGTPAYMAPEQWSGLPADARSDQFAFCVTLFSALYGRPPFEGESVTSIMAAVLDANPADIPPPERVPPALHQAILRGLARDPEQRWPSLVQLLEHIDKVITELQPGLFTSTPKPIMAIAPPILVLLPLTLLGLELGHVVDYRASNWAWLSGLQVVLMGCGAIVLRERVRAFLADSRMLVGPVFMISLVLGHRLIAAATGSSLEAMFAYDFLMLAALAGVLVLLVDRRLWPALALPLTLLALALVRPAWAPRLWAAFTIGTPPLVALTLLRDNTRMRGGSTRTSLSRSGQRTGSP